MAFSYLKHLDLGVLGEFKVRGWLPRDVAGEAAVRMGAFKGPQYRPSLVFPNP
jgi:hypothetical protein